jgi:hypothetical protein
MIPDIGRDAISDRMTNTIHDESRAPHHLPLCRLVAESNVR